MFSAFASFPSTLASSTFSFLSNRKKTFAYLGATVGGAYAVGQWSLQRMMEASERGRKQSGAKNDLLNRFNLNLQDAQFTVLALLPTVASQLQSELDVEDRTSQLGEIAKNERTAKLKEAERVRKEQEERDETQRQREQEERHESEREQERRQAETEGGTVNGDAIHSQESDEPQIKPTTNGDHPSEPEPSERQSTTLTKLSLNPTAPAFQPRFAPSPPPPRDDFPKLNGHNEADSKNSPTNASPDGDVSATEGALEEGDASGLGKSWAEVVKTHHDAETAENGQAASSEDVQMEKGFSAAKSAAEEKNQERTQEEVGPQEPSEITSHQDEPTPEPELPPIPTKSKVQLWNEIKILSFTRLFTSVYVLSLLTLQTHVQLALLGRAHYVKSLIDALPPRSPTSSDLPAFPPASVDQKGAGTEQGRRAEPTMSNEEDLEAALYKAKELPPATREEDRVSEEVERKYLTFSWWLLHEGWKVVRDRVQDKVQEVVGPMGLKTPVVYGELSALFGEIRRRIETQPDGSRFDFSAALHPPTSADEVHTLISGGGFSASSSSSSPSPSAFVTPPLRSLLNETSDFLLSSDGSLVLTLLLDQLLSLSISKLEPAFTTPIPPSTPSADSNSERRGARFEDVTEKQTRLASLLPVLTKLSAAGLEGQAGILRGGHGNEFVEAIDDIGKLREFVAIVYSSYDRDNLRASY